MGDFPVSGAFNIEEAFTNTDFETEQEAFLVATKQIPGAAASSERTIASGVIVPISGTHSIDTESNAASDDLNIIQYTNVRDGALLLLWQEDAARVVTLKHMAGGIGQINLIDEEDKVMEDKRAVLLQRRGTIWYEVFWSNEQAQLTQDADITNLEWFVTQLIGGTDGIFAYGAVLNDSLEVVAAGTPDMTVILKLGAGVYSSVPFRKASNETSDAMVAPVSTGDNRIDTVAVIAATGLLNIHTGVEDPTPSAPSVSAGELKVAEVYHRFGESAIYNTDTTGEGYITDFRSFINW